MAALLVTRLFFHYLKRQNRHKRGLPGNDGVVVCPLTAAQTRQHLSEHTESPHGGGKAALSRQHSLPNDWERCLRREAEVEHPGALSGHQMFVHTET